MPERKSGETAGKLAAYVTNSTRYSPWVKVLRDLLLTLLITGWYPMRALAQNKQAPKDLFDASMEDLMKVDIDSVYAASGYKQKITEAPASITIITSDDIRKYSYRTLADILSNVPGFYISYDRNYSYVGIRGFGRPGDYNSRILLMVDGHLMNDDIYDQALIGTEFPIDVDLIDRVEVIRGPNSSLYVANAFLGVINVITKRARNARNLTASAELASYGTFKTRLTYSNRFREGLELLLSGSFYDSRGQERLYFPEYNSPATNNGIAQDCDGDQYRQVFANLAYRGFTLQGAYGWRQKTIPTGSFGTIFNDPGTNTIDAPGYVDFKYDHKFGSDWGYRARLYYDHYTYNGTYIDDNSASGGPSRVVNKDLGFVCWLGEVLAQAGYYPVPALNSQEAVQLVAELKLTIDVAIIVVFTRCTVLTPTPISLATFSIPSPAIKRSRIAASFFSPTFGRPSFFLPSARTRAKPAMTRSRIMLRSSSANTAAICSMARPCGVVASTTSLSA